jgi:hypothetical protein
MIDVYRFWWETGRKGTTWKTQAWLGRQYYDRSSGRGMGAMDEIYMAKDRDRWRELVNEVMKLRIP